MVYYPENIVLTNYFSVLGVTYLPLQFVPARPEPFQPQPWPCSYFLVQNELKRLKFGQGHVTFIERLGKLVERDGNAKACSRYKNGQRIVDHVVTVKL